MDRRLPRPFEFAPGEFKFVFCVDAPFALGLDSSIGVGAHLAFEPDETGIEGGCRLPVFCCRLPSTERSFLDQHSPTVVPEYAFARQRTNLATSNDFFPEHRAAPIRRFEAKHRPSRGITDECNKRAASERQQQFLYRELTLRPAS
jgi:hypothetical protein